MRSLLRISLPVCLTALVVSACASSLASKGHGGIVAVGAENEYGNVISQVGGRYVTVTAIMDNPNTDPHSFEASPAVARAVSQAQLVVQNGVGYDDFMNRIEGAAPSPDRKVIDVQHLLGLPDSTANPHLWYKPSTMPAVAAAVAADLSRLDPKHAAYFSANAQAFDHSLQPWYRALAAFRHSYSGVGVAVTEPVADYMLTAAGTRIMTPFGLQLNIMNGVDPAPQSVSLESSLLAGRRVKVFLYNRQVTDTVTEGFLATAHAHHVPIVGVYETMPLGYDYQRWMLAETQALERAVANGTSTNSL